MTASIDVRGELITLLCAEGAPDRTEAVLNNFLEGQSSQPPKFWWSFGQPPTWFANAFYASVFWYPSRIRKRSGFTNAEWDRLSTLFQTAVIYLAAYPASRRSGITLADARERPQGVFDHFKGGVYLADRLERCAESGETRVSYLSLIHGTWHSRLLKEWNSFVEWPDGGVIRPRFVYRGESLACPAPPFKVPSPAP